MTLRQARCAFSLAIADLLLYAHAKGYDIALDEGKDTITAKDPTTDHMPGSLHEIGLAQDLLLYKDGQYLTNSNDYIFLGEYWEERGRLNNLPLAWGGRFKSKDANHFSYGWMGKK